MRLMLGRDFDVAQWVSRRIGQNVEPPFTAIGFARGDDLVGGAVFNDYVPGGNVEITLAADEPFTKGMLHAIAHYVFEQLGCVRLQARTKQTNVKVCKMVRRAGFVREAALKDFYGPGENAEMFRMLRKECKWL